MTVGNHYHRDAAVTPGPVTQAQAPSPAAPGPRRVRLRLAGAAGVAGGVPGVELARSLAPPLARRLTGSPAGYAVIYSTRTPGRMPIQMLSLSKSTTVTQTQQWQHIAIGNVVVEHWHHHNDDHDALIYSGSGFGPGCHWHWQ